MAVIANPEVKVSARDETRAAFEAIKQNLSGIKKTSDAVGGSFRTLAGVLTGGAFAGFVASSLQSVAALDDLSEKTTLSVELLSQLRRVAVTGGHSLDDVANSAAKFAQSVTLANAGNEKLIDAFGILQITQEQLKTQDIGSLYVQFAKNVAGAEKSATALTAATQLTGRAAKEAIPFYKDLAKQGLGAVEVTSQMAQRAEDFQKSMKLLNQQVDLFIKFPLVKAITDITSAMGVGSAAALTFAERFKLAFSGDVNIGRFVELVQQEAALKKELEGAVEKSAVGSVAASLFGGQRGKSFIEDDLKAVQAEIAALQKLQAAREQISRESAGGPTVATGDFVDEEALKRAKEAEKAMLSAMQAIGKKMVDEEKQLAEVRTDILDRFYKEGKVSEEEYWNTKLQIQQAAIDASIKEARREVEARTIALQETKGRKGTEEKDIIEAQKELKLATMELSALETQAANIRIKNFLDAKDAAKQYADAVRQIAAQLAELKGEDTAAFAVEEFRRSTEKLRNQATSERDQGTLQNIQDTEFLIRKKQEFAHVAKQSQLEQEALSIKEEEIINSRRVGAISELESLRRLSSVRQQALGQLQEFADAQARIAAESGNRELIINAERTKVALENLKAEADLVAQKFSTIFETGFTDFVSEVVSGSKTASEAFSDMVKSIVSDITRLAAQDVARKIFGGLFSGGQGGAGGGGGGGVGDIFGAFMSKIFGGSFATGLPFVPRDMLVNVHKGERIVPAAQNDAGSGDVTVNYYSSGNEDRRSQQQNAMMVGREVNTAMRRSA